MARGGEDGEGRAAEEDGSNEQGGGGTPDGRQFGGRFLPVD